MIKLASLVAAGLLVGAVSTAEAQANPQTRQGFTFAFGLGAGSGAFDCDGCDDERETGFSGFLRLGGTVKPNLIISGQSIGYTKEENGVTATAGYLLAMAQFYPQTTNGFYLEGGLGFGSVKLDDDIDELESTGMALSLGTGYDFRVGKNFSLTPYLNFATTLGAEAKANGVSTDTKLNFNVIQLGLGFTWH